MQPQPPAPTNQPNVSPESYTAIISQIAEQLKSRKGLILKRTAFASGPLIVALAILTNLQKLLDSFGTPHDQIGMIDLVTTVVLVFIAMP